MAHALKIRPDSRALATRLVRGKALWRFPNYKYVPGTIKGDEVIEFWDLFTPIYIPESEKDTVHVVRQGEEGRLDLLAYRYYGNTRLWWAIAKANKMVNVIDEMFAGAVLRIPDREMIEVALDTARRQVVLSSGGTK